MLTSMGDIMREAYRRGWVTTRDGNISLRRGDKFYITPSGGRKSIIHPEHIQKAIVKSDGVLEWRTLTPNPSGELEMHRVIQMTDFKNCRAAVHLHPTYTIAAMHRGFDLQKLSEQFPEVSRYTRVGPTVRVLPVTSQVLADETFASLFRPKWVDNGGKFPNGEGYCDLETKLEYDIVGQAGHGVCAVAKTPWDAFEHIERLEHICQIVLASGVTP